MAASNRSITKYFSKEFFKNWEITYPDEKTRRNEPKWGNPPAGLVKMAKLSLFTPNTCAQKS